MSVINIEGNTMEYLGDITTANITYEVIEANKFAFSFEGSVYPYRGVTTNDALKFEEQYGIYYNLDDEEYNIIGDSEYSENDIEEESEGFTLDGDLLNGIKNIKNDENIKKKKKANKKTTTQRANDFIRFEINDEDDLMVRLIKERINECNITMNDVYEKYPTEGYNLYYGLLNRSTITFKSLQKWCEITNSEFEMSIKDK